MWGVLVGALHLCVNGLRVFRVAVLSVFCYGYLWRFYSKAVSIGLGVSCNLIAILCPVVARWSVSSCLFIIIHIDIVGNRLIAFLLYIGHSEQKKIRSKEKAFHRVKV